MTDLGEPALLARSRAESGSPGGAAGEDLIGGTGPRERSRSGTARLVLGYAATAFALVTLNFFLPRAMPGDPISVLVSADSGRALDASSRAAVERYYGLDRSLPAQYASYLGRLVQGDLGLSVRYRQPVSRLLADRLPWTLLLGGTAVALGGAAGMVAGVHSGWRRGRRVDDGLLAVLVTLGNVPPFVLGSAALFLFGVKLGWVPLAGAADFPGPNGPVAWALDVAHHLVLPATVMAAQFVMGQYLVMRAGMVAELGSDYLVLGRAKGLGERRLKYAYAGRNALLPVVSLLALQLSVAVSGALFVETLFAYPGLGRLTFEAIGVRDYPLMQGCFLAFSVTVLVLNLLADLTHARLDPRTSP